MDPENRAALRGRQLVTELRDTRGFDESESAEHRQLDAGAASIGTPRGVRPWRAAATAAGDGSRVAPALEPSRACAAAPRPAADESVVDLAVAPPDDGDTSFEIDGDVQVPAEPAAAAPPDASTGSMTLEMMAPPEVPRPPRKTRPPAPGGPPRGTTAAALAAKTMPGKPLKAKRVPAAEAKAVPFAKPAPSAAAPTMSEKAFTPPAPSMPPTPAPPKPAPKKAAVHDDDDDDDRSRWQKLVNNKWTVRTLVPVGLLCFSYLMYDTFLNGPNVQGAMDRGKVAHYPVAHKVAAAGLWDEFAKDSKAAQAKYHEKYVELTGRVKSVESDKLTVTLEGAAAADKGVACEFAYLFKPEDLAAIKAGSEIKLEGEVMGQAKPGAEVRVTECKTFKE